MGQVSSASSGTYDPYQDPQFGVKSGVTSLVGNLQSQGQALQPWYGDPVVDMMLIGSVVIVTVVFLAGLYIGRRHPRAS